MHNFWTGFEKQAGVFQKLVNKAQAATMPTLDYTALKRQAKARSRILDAAARPTASVTKAVSGRITPPGMWHRALASGK